MAWLDTPESWSWIIDSWAYIWRACGAKAGETAIFPFSFGPFIGFWSAFEAASKVDLRCIPLGGQQSFERLQMIFRHQKTWRSRPRAHAPSHAAIRTVLSGNRISDRAPSNLILPLSRKARITRTAQIYKTKRLFSKSDSLG